MMIASGMAMPSLWEETPTPASTRFDSETSATWLWWREASAQAPLGAATATPCNPNTAKAANATIAARWTTDDMAGLFHGYRELALCDHTSSPRLIPKILTEPSSSTRGMARTSHGYVDPSARRYVKTPWNVGNSLPSSTARASATT